MRADVSVAVTQLGRMSLPALLLVVVSGCGAVTARPWTSAARRSDPTVTRWWGATVR